MYDDLSVEDALADLQEEVEEYLEDQE
jgi:hypothetical protein